MSAFCRDCLADAAPHAARCGTCGSPRLLRHRELAQLAIAHVDCDAFYATIEKRDDPSLVAEPVIVGGGRRGVVAAACYVARTFGVKSAMPMFEALRLCPHARVIRPNMEKYARVGREVRQLMLDLDAAGRAAVDRRSVPRPFRHRAAAWAVAGQGAGPLCRRCRKESRHHRLHRSLRQQVPRQDRLRSRQAAGLCGARLERSAGIPGAEAGELHLRRRQGERGAARARRLSPHRRSAGGERDRDDATLRRGRKAARPPRARHRPTQGQRRPRNQERVRGDHVRPRHIRFPRARADSLGADGGDFRSPQGKGAGRRDRDAEAENCRFSHSHPRAFVRGADAARGENLRRSTRPCSSAKPTARNSVCSVSA